MATWTSDELDKIGSTEELEIAALRQDGTLRKPVTVWVVRQGDGLYVRSWKGRGAAWFRGAQASHQGHISAGGLAQLVTFVETDDPALNDQIDAEYRTKYRRHGAQFVDPMVAPEARSTTLALVPR